MPDYYAVLDLDRKAGVTAIDQAYKRLMALHQGNDAVLQQLTEAYNVLSNPITRNRYDRSLADAPPAAQARPAEPPAAAAPRRPPTEVIEVPPAAAPRRPPTEVMDTFVSVNQNRTPRPRTEPIQAVSPAAAPPAREPTDPPAASRERPPTETLAARDPRPEATTRPPGRPVPSGPIHILIHLPDGEIEPYELDDGRHVVGRPSKSGPEPNIKLNDRFVSREHAVITKGPGTLHVTDSSSNGTRLNGERLPPGQPRPLGENDILEIEGFRLQVIFPPETP